MKYTSEEALDAILKRKDALVLRRSRRSQRLLSGASALLAAALLFVIVAVSGRANSSLTGTVYGSFLLSAEAGGYVLATVIAFALGVAVTLACLKRKKTHAKGEQNQEEQV